jgi:hypothetical protein
MGWYLCTIASTSRRNWNLCKESNTWGINTKGDYSSHDKARKGDNLLFWLGGEGFVGYARVIEDTRPPKNMIEVPWNGGQETYGLIIPIDSPIEFSSPKKFSFVNRRQEKTGLDQSMFQRGYMPITDASAEAVIGEEFQGKTHGN